MAGRGARAASGAHSPQGRKALAGVRPGPSEFRRNGRLSTYRTTRPLHDGRMDARGFPNSRGSCSHEWAADAGRKVPAYAGMT